MKWQLSEEQQYETNSTFLSFWQLIRGESSTSPSSTLEQEAAKKENSPAPISISPAQPKQTPMNDVQVIEVDLTTTEDNEDEQKICTIEPPRHSPRKEDELPELSGEDTLDNFSN